MKLLQILFLSYSCTALMAETWNGKADIRFDGTSTLHDWGGKVSAQAFQAEVILKNGNPSQISSMVTVKAAQMDTAHEKRDQNMFKAMKVKDYPLISAKIDVDFSQIAEQGTPKKLPLTLTLLGKSHSIAATISNWKRKDGHVSFDLEFPVSMKASGIYVPSVLLMIRVGDEVKVRANVQLTK